jgi:hypothetical protein
MRGWRGNCDIQLLIYKSSPDEVDVSDITRVTNYVVSYACKGSESVVEEKKQMATIVRAAQEKEGDVRDVTRLARKMLNECTKNRVVSKQEAVYQLGGMPLYTCSEFFERTSLSGSTRLGTENAGKRTFLYRYSARQDCLDMNLDEYFHHIYNSDTAKRIKIPVYSGAQCEPVYPATPGYARAVLMIYKSWRQVFSMDDADEVLLAKFHKFIKEDKCPESVRLGYERAKETVGMKETINSANDIDYGSFAMKADQEIVDLVDLANIIYRKYDENDDREGNYDFGMDKDWSQKFVEVRWF